MGPFLCSGKELLDTPRTKGYKKDENEANKDLAEDGKDKDTRQSSGTEKDSGKETRLSPHCEWVKTPTVAPDVKVRKKSRQMDINRIRKQTGSTRITQTTRASTTRLTKGRGPCIQ